MPGVRSITRIVVASPAAVTFGLPLFGVGLTMSVNRRIGRPLSKGGTTVTSRARVHLSLLLGRTGVSGTVGDVCTVLTFDQPDQTRPSAPSTCAEMCAQSG